MGGGEAASKSVKNDENLEKSSLRNTKYTTR